MTRLARVAVSAVLSVTFAVMAGCSLVVAWEQAAAGRWWVAAGATLAAVALLSFMSVSIQETHRAISRRGYARPLGPGLFEQVARLIPRQVDASHPALSSRSVYVKFDDGSIEPVNLADLYYTLLDEYGQDAVLPWRRAVVSGGMDKQQWAAIRQALKNAEAVGIDRRGTLRLNCTPWTAVERVQRYYSS
jgi:hypothetical protein